MAKYFLTIDTAPEREVTRDEFIAMERICGFIPKPGCGPCATGGFGLSKAGVSIRGRIEESLQDLREEMGLK